MMTDEVLYILTNVSKRLATLADHAHETREQAQHTLDRIYLLRQYLDELKQRILSESEMETPVPLPSEVR